MAVILQQATKPLSTFNRDTPRIAEVSSVGEQQSITLPLMVPLPVVMATVFSQDSPQRIFAEQDDL